MVERIEFLRELEELVCDDRELQRLDAAPDRRRQFGTAPHQLPHLAGHPFLQRQRIE